MKDDKGLYYYPFPSNKRVRMYVQETEGAVCFRLWDADDSVLWIDHGWVPYEAIVKAASMYEGKSFNPTQAYDIKLATALIQEKK